MRLNKKKKKTDLTWCEMKQDNGPISANIPTCKKMI